MTATTAVHSILVPIDLSAGTSRILKFAAAIARSFHGNICLLHCIEQERDTVCELGIRPVSMYEFSEHHSKEFQQLTEEAASLESDGFDIQLDIVQGPVAEAILATAQQNQIDLIVIGSQGHDAVWDHEVGSITEEVLSQADIPVLVVPTVTKKPAQRCLV